MGNLLLAKSRIKILVLCMVAIFGILTAQLIRVQIIQASHYQSKAANEMESTRVIPAPRGDITDINGVPFARSVAAISVVVDQTQISDPTRVANFVAPILGLPVSEVQSSITGNRKYSMVLKNGRPILWEQLTQKIYEYNQSLDKNQLDKRIIGFFPERSYIREYPSGSLISSLVGFVRANGVGASGLEYSLNSTITGVDGRYSFAGGNGAEIPGSQREIIEAKAGTSIRLTIDRDVQWVASQAIEEAVRKAHAQSGTVIVMDPRTGAILAHATAPTFDPNNTKNLTQNLIRNPSVEDVYEPGSTGIVMTLAAALEEISISPNTVFTVPYSIKRGGSTFHDHEKHPVQHLTSSGILAVSSNTGTIKIGELMSHDTLHSYLLKFGIGSKTGSGLPGESAGLLRNVSNWSGTTAPTVAFGQGYSLTAMQATSVFATIANNGVRVTPTVIAGTRDASGSFSPNKSQSSQRVISEDTAIKMRLMMENVVSAQGTAPTAAIPGYRVAGKTGTAMRYNQKTGGYSGYTASFIGFAPADAPRYVISVTLQDPRNGHYGGALGGPVFKKVMTFVLQSKHVPPTNTAMTPVALTRDELAKLKITQVSNEKSGSARQ
jgi:cell division protein FtsI (penicillin-binding protein 3)